ncbi:MAG: hypothetical protein ACK4VI_06935 [Alphaproteobacteria bacterium]
MIQYQSYRHTDEQQVLSTTLDILNYSAKAKSLLDLLRPQIIVIKGILPQAYVYQDKIIYLRVPGLQSQGRIEQAIDLGGALIEMKINRALAPIPLDQLDNNDVITDQHLKNVSIILKSFKIAEELEENGFKAIKELRFMGLGKIYQAWKTGKTEQDCASIYWEMFDYKDTAQTTDDATEG